nr:MAG TPA: hypothetical protein [Caudoviricetes sp.]
MMALAMLSLLILFASFIDYMNILLHQINFVNTFRQKILIK